jgi:hypothetical protein
MSYSAILARIKSTLDALNQGTVYDYEVIVTDPQGDWGTDLDFFRQSDNTIEGWTCHRESVIQSQETMGEIGRLHGFVLRRIKQAAANKAVDAVFQAEIDAAIDAFNTDETLSGTCETTRQEGVGLQADYIGKRMVGDIWCNAAECRLSALERIAD